MSDVFLSKCSPRRRDTEGNIIFESTPHELERQIMIQGFQSLLWKEITKLKDLIKLLEEKNEKTN
jgi:hypothetical protein